MIVVPRESIIAPQQQAYRVERLKGKLGSRLGQGESLGQPWENALGGVGRGGYNPAARAIYPCWRFRHNLALFGEQRNDRTVAQPQPD